MHTLYLSNTNAAGRAGLVCSASCFPNEVTLLDAMTGELRGRAFLEVLLMPNWRAGLA